MTCILSAAKGLHRGQRGQTTVFVALSMLVLVCFLAFMVNLGQVVHDRVLLQSATDMVALSGANVQAAGLNEIADLNLEIAKLLTDLRADLGYPYRIWITPAEALRVVQYYYYWIQYCYVLQNRASKAYAAGARQAGREVFAWYQKEYGPGPGSKGTPPGRPAWGMEELIHPTYPGFTFSDLPPWPEKVFFRYLIPSTSPEAPLWTVWKWIAPAPQAGGGRHAMVSLPGKGYLGTGSAALTGTVRKDIFKTVYYRVRLSRGEGRPFVNVKEVGFKVSNPAMEAYSLALPTGGDINQMKPTYRARFVPLRTTFNYDVMIPNREKFRH